MIWRVDPRICARSISCEKLWLRRARFGRRNMFNLTHWKLIPQSSLKHFSTWQGSLNYTYWEGQAWCKCCWLFLRVSKLDSFWGLGNRRISEWHILEWSAFQTYPLHPAFQSHASSGELFQWKPECNDLLSGACCDICTFRMVFKTNDEQIVDVSRGCGAHFQYLQKTTCVT